MEDIVENHKTEAMITKSCRNRREISLSVE